MRTINWQEQCQILARKLALAEQRIDALVIAAERNRHKLWLARSARDKHRRALKEAGYRFTRRNTCPSKKNV